MTIEEEIFKKSTPNEQKLKEYGFKKENNIYKMKKSFMDDILVMPVNMAGLPGMNIPVGFDQNHMPIGMQIIGNSFEEAKMYQLASFIEKELNLDLTPFWKGEEHE